MQTVSTESFVFNQTLQRLCDYLDPVWHAWSQWMTLSLTCTWPFIWSVTHCLTPHLTRDLVLDPTLDLWPMFDPTLDLWPHVCPHTWPVTPCLTPHLNRDPVIDPTLDLWPHVWPHTRPMTPCLTHHSPVASWVWAWQASGCTWAGAVLGHPGTIVTPPWSCSWADQTVRDLLETQTHTFPMPTIYSTLITPISFG